MQFEIYLLEIVNEVYFRLHPKANYDKLVEDAKLRLDKKIAAFKDHTYDFKFAEFGWQNPFDKSIEAQRIAAEKYKTAIQNNVKILYKEDYQKYIDWFYKNNYNVEDYIFK